MSETKKELTALFAEQIKTTGIHSITINGLPSVEINKSEIPEINFFGDEQLIDHIVLNVLDGHLTFTADPNFPKNQDEEFKMMIAIDKLDLLNLRNIGAAEIAIICLNPAATGLDARAIGVLHCHLVPGHALIKMNAIGTFASDGTGDMSSISYLAVGDFQSMEIEL